MNRHLNRLFVLALLAGPHLARAQGGGASGGDPAGRGGIFEVLGIEWQGILIQICGFILLFLILRKFLFGPLMGALATRRVEIQGAYDRIEEERQAVERQRVDLEQRLASIESEARGRIQSAVNEGKALQDQIVTDARQQAERVVEQGRARLRMEEEKAIATLRSEMADLAVRAAGQILGESLNDERHRRLVTEFISQVGS